MSMPLANRNEYAHESFITIKKQKNKQMKIVLTFLHVFRMTVKTIRNFHILFLPVINVLFYSIPA